MKLRMLRPPKLETYTFLFSMPLIALAFNVILYRERVWQDINMWLVSFPLIYLIGAVSWYGHVIWADAVERRFPDLNQTRQRIFWKALVLFVVMTPTVMIAILLFDYFSVLGYSLREWDLVKGMLLGMSVNLVFESLYESEYVLGKYKDSILEKESIRQFSVRQEFDVLKGQVNPHFLFNCFNTLSSLITEDKQKAEAFLNELSKVYRYLLRNNEDGMSTVENEVRFIQSYYKLLQTRHGDAVQLHLEIDRRYNPYLLPSLTLQLLVENVVKHNVLSRNKPLVIDIFTTAGNKLIVNNNLQRRTVKAPSNKVGLENIRAKYALLGQDGFQVMEDKNNFTVVLPLIWNSNVQPQTKCLAKVELPLND